MPSKDRPARLRLAFAHLFFHRKQARVRLRFIVPLSHRIQQKIGRRGEIPCRVLALPEDSPL